MPDNSIEEWRPIERSRGHFEVSNLGRVRRALASRSSPAGQVLKSHVGSHGYLQVHMSCDGKLIHATVHTLVAEAFLGPKPSPKHQVNHLDGIKSHSYVGNLEWTTPGGNTVHAVRMGLFIPSFGNAKLNERQVRAIRRVSQEFTHAEIADVVGISQSEVGKIRRRDIWKNVL